jgi:hypothetical protein
MPGSSYPQKFRNYLYSTASVQLLVGGRVVARCLVLEVFIQEELRVRPTDLTTPQSAGRI